MASLTKVIKVQYAETLRRFNACVNENNQLDLDMVGLREKILSLFNLHPDADITMTYIDEDGDVVTLVDDGDLHDTMRQKLKFLKIFVLNNNDKSAKSSGSSTPLRSPQGPPPVPNFDAGAALKSLPEPFREFALASKAASSSPVFAELVDWFSKMGLSYLIPDAQVHTAGDSGKQSSASESPVAPSAAGNPNYLKADGKSKPILKSAAEESSIKKGSTPVNGAPAGSSFHTSDARKGGLRRFPMVFSTFIRNFTTRSLLVVGLQLQMTQLLLLPVGAFLSKEITLKRWVVRSIQVFAVMAVVVIQLLDLDSNQ